MQGITATRVVAAPRQDTTARPLERVRCDGKFFAAGDRRFQFRGVTYGTFMSRASDGALFPGIERVEDDFDGIRENGFTVVRTYTPPPRDVREAARERGLRLFAGVFYPDWRYVLGASKAERRRVAREARLTVRTAARDLAGDPVIAALSIGNEIPADVIRWVGADEISGLLGDLVDIVHEADPEIPVSYANFPTAEYLPLPDLDFLTFNVFLERRSDFRAYLTRLHHLAGDRPLVLGEIGLDAGPSEERQAEVLEWQLSTALERGVAGTCVFSWTDEWAVADRPVEGWSFGVTDADRAPRPALDVARRWNSRSLPDLPHEWPSMSVVICGHNAGATLDECLEHTCALDYPDLDIVVVDDGSSDDTAEIARRHARARLFSIEHGGLSVARNVGWREAKGDLIAYLDADAYPTPEWPYLLALAFDGPNVGGAGGPNVPPPDDPFHAQAVARAPGGPVHVLTADDRAEHVPGCNMAFWKPVLAEVGGFDPVYRAAGDDVDLCWKVLARGWSIGFHPAASVWHHRRPGLRPYARQQRGYGRAEALVQARHPDHFTPLGTARWRGSIYDSFVPSLARQRVYRGLYGAAAYQSVYRDGGHLLDVVHQVGVPLAVALAPTAPLAFVAPGLGVPSLVAVLFLAVLWLVDALRVQPPRGLGDRARFRATVATLHVVQPIARLWGRWRAGSDARRELPSPAPIAGPARPSGRGVLLFPLDRARDEFVPLVVDLLRHHGLPVVGSTGWEAYDATVCGSSLAMSRLVTSAFPEGAVQLRLTPALHRRRIVLAGVLAVGATLAHPVAGLLAAGAIAGNVLYGLYRSGPFVRRLVAEAAGTPA